jgi:DNA-binding NtrC family response regulator
VLIVDDNEELCKNLSDILEFKGYDAAIAYDGYQAIDAVKKGRFDIVVMDVKMPGMSGVDTLKMLKQAAPDMTVILITAFADDIFYKEGLKKDIDYEVIQKPIDIDQLLAMFERIN